MILKDKIKTNSLSHLQEKLREGSWQEVADFFETLMTKRFTVAETGVDRKLLHYWNEKGIVPFQKVEGWDKFSFIEVCWLRFLNELKSLDIGIKNLQRAKAFLIDDRKFMLDFFGVQSTNNLKNKKIDFGEKKVTLNEEMIDLLMQNQYVKFSIILVTIILLRSNIAVYLDNKGDIGTIEIDLLQNNPEEQIPLWIKFFKEKSVSIINLTTIVTAVSETKEVFEIDNDIITMKQSAKALIKKFFNNESVSEISIRMNDKKFPLLTITHRLSYDQLYQKVNALQRKGVFVDMTIKTRDGKVEFFESKELIKL